MPITAEARTRQNQYFFSTLLVLRRIQMIRCRVSSCVFPAKEPVRKLTIGWINTVRPSRQLLRSFLRMRHFLNAIKGFPHAEEHPKGASRSTHGRNAANFLTAAKAGVQSLPLA
jgi:hypothetical protein